MLIYDKIAWYMDASANPTKDSLGKEKYRLILKGLNDMKESGYSYGIELLTPSLLREFSDIYTHYIAGKDNPHPVDVYTYNMGKMAIRDLYISYVRDGHGALIAGGICSHKKTRDKMTFMLSFRAKSSDILFQKLRLGYYIEYLFFTQGVDLQVDQYSRGRDTNGYGQLGSAIGVGTHKLQLHFFPYKAFSAKIIDIDEQSIIKNSLFILGTDTNEKLNRAAFFLKEKDGSTQKYLDMVHILEKRGFQVDIHMLN